MPTLRDFDAVAEARTRDDLLQALVAVAQKLGFPLLTTLLVIERANQPKALVPLANTPAAFEAESRDPQAWKRDPVLRSLSRLSVPIVWDQQTYAAAGAGDLWEVQAPFGYRNGVAVALHMPGARHFLLGIDRDEKLPSGEQRLARLLADVQFLAVHAQDAAVRLLAPLALPSNTPPLTARELDVLRWTMLGKDAQAIADILGVSRRTVKFHVDNAIAKLSCENKHAAVLRALEYGLLNKNP